MRLWVPRAYFAAAQNVHEAVVRLWTQCRQRQQLLVAVATAPGVTLWSVLANVTTIDPSEKE